MVMMLKMPLFTCLVENRVEIYDDELIDFNYLVRPSEEVQLNELAHMVVKDNRWGF